LVILYGANGASDADLLAKPSWAGLMRLIDDWHWVVNHAWSMRLLILAAVLTGAEAALPLIADKQSIFSQQAFALILFAVVVGAFFSRLIAQRDPPESVEPPK
jgi:hypothetical protein